VNNEWSDKFAKPFGGWDLLVDASWLIGEEPHEMLGEGKPEYGEWREVVQR
jgi:hypothetical protein